MNPLLFGQQAQTSPYLQQALQAISQQPATPAMSSDADMADAMKMGQARRTSRANQPAMDSVNASLAGAGLSPVAPQNFGQRLLGGLHLFGGS